MASGGDFKAVPFGTVVFQSMSTAIYSAYTRNGFLVAADGRRTGEYPSDTAQKILSFRNNPSVAYTFLGYAELGPDGSPEVSFRFSDEVDIFCEVSKRLVNRSGRGIVRRA